MRKPFLTVLGALALVVITALTTIAAMGGFDRKATPPAAAPRNYTPASVTKQEMLATITPASPEIAAAVKAVAFANKGTMEIKAADHVYVARTDVALALSDEPITVVLPVGLRWTKGQLGNTVLFRTDDTSVKSVKNGAFVFTDPMCQADFLGMAKGVCGNLNAQRPGDWNQMLTHLRRPTEAELKQWLGSDYVAGYADTYYVALNDFTAAPSYVFDGNDNKVPGETSGIFVPTGVKVLGGQLGFMDLYPIDMQGHARANSVTDPLCFMYDVPVVSDNGLPNQGKTGTFAPEIEQQRVSGCTRPKQ